jgi:hypothetical protein
MAKKLFVLNLKKKKLVKNETVFFESINYYKKIWRKGNMHQAI